MKFCLLHEEAGVKKDAFKHQTHQNVADSLAAIIAHEECGATIGLEGPWGGGKSVVLSLLKRKLLSLAHVFLFDAWAHEGDFLRLAFLVSMIENLLKAVSDGALNGDIAWLEDKEKIISGRKKVVSINTKRKPTAPGIWAVFFAALFAIGIAFVQLMVNDKCELQQPYFWIAIILCVAPFIAAALRWVCLGLFCKRWLDASDWAFLQADSDSTKTQDVSDSPERSSVEFARLFGEIMAKVVEWNPAKKFIIALDNLDRIPQENAFALWSTMQTFLQKRNDEPKVEDEWFKKLWLVVPYDSDGVKDLWRTKGSDADKLANSFMDKSFQLRVEVPAPVLSDWEDFARKQFKAAFGEGYKTEVEEALRIFKVMRDDLASIPTPRQIKNFVNQFALLLEQFDVYHVSPSVLAFYAIKRFVGDKRLSVEEVRSLLVSDEDKLVGQKKIFLPPNWKDHLAGIVFGVNPEDGRQLLLEPEIANSVADFASDGFAKLIERHADSAWMVFESMLSNRYVWESELEIGSFLDVLCAISKVRVLPPATSQTLKDRVSGYINRIATIAPESLLALVPTEQDDVERNVAAIYGAVVVLGAEDVGSLYKIVMSVANYRVVSEDDLAVTQLGLTTFRLIEAFPVQNRTMFRAGRLGMANKLAEFCSSITPDKFTLAQWFRPSISLVNTVPTLFPPNQTANRFADEVVHYLIETHDELDWGGSIDAIKKHLCQNNGWATHDRPSNIALRALLRLAGTGGKNRQLMVDICNRVEFWNFVGSSSQERDRDAALLLASCNPDGADTITVSPFANSQNGIGSARARLDDDSEGNVKGAIVAIQECGLENALRDYWWKGKRKLYGALVKYAMSDTAARMLFAKDDVFDNVWVYRRHLENVKSEGKDSLIAEHLQFMESEFGMLDALKAKNFSENERTYCMTDFVNLIKVFPDCKEVRDNIWQSFRSDCTDDEFVQYIGETEFVDMLNAFRQFNGEYSLDFEFYRALKRMLVAPETDADKKQSAEVLTQWKDGRLGVFVEALDKTRLQQLVKDMTKRFATDDSLDHRGYYELAKDCIDVGLIPAGKIDDWLWESISNKCLGDVEWVSDLVSRGVENRSYSVSDEVRSALREPLQKFAEEVKDDAAKLKIIEDVASRIGIDLSGA